MSPDLKSLLINMKTTADPAGESINSLLNEYLVTAITADLDDRLDEKQKAGKYGWWSASVCSIEDLEAGLKRAIDRQEMIDVIAYAGMIYAREHVIQKKGLSYATA